jgi:hypothetical protein
MTILASLLSALIGGKPEAAKPAQQSQPVIPPPVQQAADIPPVVEKPVIRQHAVQTYAPGPEPFVEPPSVFSPRSMKQLGLFAAGAGFLVLSTTITRRAVNRRILSSRPMFYHPSHQGAMKQGNPDGPFIAAEALGLATLNVFAFAVMATGGLAWAWDVSNVEDLRNRARRKLYGEAGAVDEEAEKEMEEWMAKVLSMVKKDDEGKDKEEGKKE